MPKCQRDTQSGIAIGQILFIIVILAIIAAAIAAGSGSFTANTNTENAKMKASTLIQIGDSLRTGADKLVAENSVAPSAITFDNTPNTGLYSPTGGGITPPSVAMAAVPGDWPQGTWIYMYTPFGSFGTSAPDLEAELVVAKDVCQQVNLIANGISGSPPATGDLTGNWPVALNGKPTGCFLFTGNNLYVFYQILVVQ